MFYFAFGLQPIVQIMTWLFAAGRIKFISPHSNEFRQTIERASTGVTDTTNQSGCLVFGIAAHMHFSPYFGRQADLSILEFVNNFLSSENLPPPMSISVTTTSI